MEVCLKNQVYIDDTRASIPFMLIFSIIAVVATIGNGVSLVVFFKYCERSYSNLFLTSLCLSDFLVGLLLSPLLAWQIYDVGLLDNCEVNFFRRFLLIALCGASIFSMAVIGVDRYLFIAKSKDYKQLMTKSRVIILLLVNWLLPMAIPPLQYLNEALYSLFVVLPILIPYIILIVSYLKILKVLRYHERKAKDTAIDVQSHSAIDIHDENSSTDTEGRKFRQRHNSGVQIRVTKSISILILCYGMCLLPVLLFHLFNIIDKYTGFLSKSVNDGLNLVSLVTSLMNSCINPIIYIRKNPEFLQGYNKLIRRS